MIQALIASVLIDPSLWVSGKKPAGGANRNRHPSWGWIGGEQEKPCRCEATHSAL